MKEYTGKKYEWIFAFEDEKFYGKISQNRKNIDLR